MMQQIGSASRSGSMVSFPYKYSLQCRYRKDIRKVLVAKGSTSVGRSHTCLRGEGVDGKKERSTGLGHGSFSFLPPRGLWPNKVGLMVVGQARVAKASVSFGHSHTCLGGERLSGKEPVHRSWARVLALADKVLF